MLTRARAGSPPASIVGKAGRLTQGEKDRWPPPAPRTLVLGARRRGILCSVGCRFLHSYLASQHFYWQPAHHYGFCRVFAPSRQPFHSRPPGSQSATGELAGDEQLAGCCGPGLRWAMLLRKQVPHQWRKRMFWKPGGRGGGTSLLASRGLCTSLPTTTSQPGLGGQHWTIRHTPQGASDQGSMGSHIRQENTNTSKGT